MNARLRFLVVMMGALVVVAVFAFPLWRPIFVRTVVNQGFPGLAADQQAAFQLLSPTQQKAYQDLMPTNATMAVAMAQFGVGPDSIVPTEDQALPDMTDPVILGRGFFTQLDAIHTATGTATLYELPDKSRVLRFDDFKVTNGPSLHVLLTRRPDPRLAADVGNDYIDLGAIKGNVGNQNYNVPSEVDFSVYQGIVIYSLPFQVVFSTAKVTLS